MAYLDYEKMRKALFNRTEGYAACVRSIYRKALGEIVELVKDTELEDEKSFSFSEYGYSGKVNPILRRMYSETYRVIRDGSKKEWINADDNNDGLVRAVFGNSSVQDYHFSRYFKRNQEAMDAFLCRKSGLGGINLSQRVWNYTEQYREELEKCLDLAIGEGTPSYSIAARVRKYLNDPDSFYRRFRVKIGEDENGNAVYGSIWKRRVYDKEMQSYRWINASPNEKHPGRGVYRSSARNAQRLARTETNMAYRSSDYERWQRLPFVTGIEICLSNNPNHVTDICDDLKGVYPKDFKWTGWHPNCRCYMKPVLASQAEVDGMMDKIMDGVDPDSDSVNMVMGLPSNFTDWVMDNRERIDSAESVPYFLSDNASIIPSSKHSYTGSKSGREATKQAREALDGHTERTDFSPQQIENFADITKATGYVRGEPMTFEDADNGKANVYKDGDNCTACVLAHELRLRGYDITALPFSDDKVFSALSYDTRLAWMTDKGDTAEFTALIGGEEKDIIAKMEKQTKVIGSRYHLGWDMSEDLGHIITVERTKKGLVFYDPQQDNFLSLGEIIGSMLNGSKLQLIRVDKLLINANLLKSLTTALE